ncbi:MAG: hypothetical protein HY927_15890 [Elusimicrobia bacterium]|nr:hypothetical protein [Elusimicrobiota bacterium]
MDPRFERPAAEAESELSKAAGKLIKGYYYLAPLWFLLETYCWPGLRARALVGPSVEGRVGFYAAEALIGAGFWRGLPAAEVTAVVENVACLISTYRFILFAPLTMALGVDSGTGSFMAQDYVEALPGALFSSVQVTISLYRGIYRLQRRLEQKFRP